MENHVDIRSILRRDDRRIGKLAFQVDEDESFILIYLDRTNDEWVVELSENLDGLLVANLFNVFQGRLLESLLQQKQAFLAEATADVEHKKSSA